MENRIQKHVDRMIELMDKAKTLPQHLQDTENRLFFEMDEERKPLEKAVAYKKWKDFILNNIPND